MNTGSWNLWLFVLVLLCLPGAVPTRATAESDPVQVLVLTDGSRERVRGYSVEGDRLRYWSAERNEWEEMPAALVDWPATQRQALRAADEASERTGAALESAERERLEDAARTPLVAPGMRLPAPGKVYLRDLYQGEPALVLLGQSGGELHKNTKSNILRGILNPIASSRQTIELEGSRAIVRSHAPVPEIYFPVEPGERAPGGDGAPGGGGAHEGGRLRLVSCEDKGGNRVVFSYNIAVYGRVSVRARYVETVVEPVSDYWVKVTPAAPLDPGEYALIEFDREGAANEFVWDFAVDPLAPPNPAVRSGDADRAEPVLILKPESAGPKEKGEPR